MSPRRRQTKAFIVRPPPQSILRLAVVAALLGGAADASAYGLKHTASGAVVAWPMTELPIHVYVSTSGLGPEHQALLADALDGAIAAWNGESGLELVLDHGAAPVGAAMHAIVVRWDREPWKTNAQELAITALAFAPATGAIEGAQVRVNDAFSWAPLPTNGGQRFLSGYDLQGTLTHELGHAIGLAHSDVESATMHLGTIEGQQGKRTLDPDDIAALRVLYGPPGASRPLEASMGCADVSALPAAHAGLAALLALLVLLGGRRRAPARADAKIRRPKR